MKIKSVQVESGSEQSSDEELRAAYESGLIVPGLNIVEEQKREPINNEVSVIFERMQTIAKSSQAALCASLKALRKNLPWIETQDVTTKREIQEVDAPPSTSHTMRDLKADPEGNDFARECSLHVYDR